MCDEARQQVSRESYKPMSITRRAFLGAAAAAPFITSFSVRASDAPISFYVPYGAGGPVDGITRYLADGLTKVMGRTFLVENRPGGNGIVAAQFVASSRQPETSLFVAGTGPFSLNLLLRKSLPFTRDQFKPVSLVADGPLAITVSSKNPAQDLKTFVDNAKASGKAQRFGTFGPGSLSQLFGALVNQELGFEVAEVAYKTTAEEVRDILAGQVDFTVSSPLGVLGQIRAGEMRMLAVARDERTTQLPDVPTFKELGHPELTASFWTGILAPTGMPDELVTEINAAIDQVLADPKTDEFLDRLGQYKIGGAPQVFADQLAKDEQQWGGIIKARNFAL